MKKEIFIRSGIIAMLAAAVFGLSAIAQSAGTGATAAGSSASSTSLDAQTSSSLNQLKSGSLNLSDLVVKNLTISTGTPAPGKVLTALDSTGKVGWASPVTATGTTDRETYHGYKALTPVQIFRCGFSLDTVQYPMMFSNPNTSTCTKNVWTSIPYPASIPTTTGAISIHFFAISNGGSEGPAGQTPITQVFARSNNMTGRLMAAASDGRKDMSANIDNNSVLIPYSPSRTVEIMWNTYDESKSAVGAYIEGYQD